MPTSDPTPADMAVEALHRLGQDAGDNPMITLFALTDQIGNRVREIRNDLSIIDGPPVDFDEYDRLRDALLVALVATVHVSSALEADVAPEMYGAAEHAEPVNSR